MDERIPISPANPLEGLEIRYTELSDTEYLREWLKELSVWRCFPMFDEVEIEDAVQRWMEFARYKCSLTATMKGDPCGMVTLYLQPYHKLAHQCEFGIIVGNGFRGKGVGGELIKNCICLAKSFFNIELLHLQVYDENPAMHFYLRWGFKEFGRQSHWIKEAQGDYHARVFMEKFI